MFANTAYLSHFHKYADGGAGGVTVTQPAGGDSSVQWDIGLTWDSGLLWDSGAPGSGRVFVTGISGFLDTDAIITIKDGTTVVWETKVDVSAEGTTFFFNVGVIPITPGGDAVGNVSASTADCAVSITGFIIF